MKRKTLLIENSNELSRVKKNLLEFLTIKSRIKPQIKY